MFGNKFFFLGIFLFLGAILNACARPNYQNPTPVAVGGFSQTAETCDLNFKTQSLCAEIEWETAPSQQAMGSFLLHFYSPGHPETPTEPSLNPAVVLWMPAMGHGSSPVTLTYVSPGIWRATRVFFIMAGEWEIHLQLKDTQNNVVDQTVQDIRI